MSSIATDCRSTVIPCLRYRNAPEAIEWLCQAFGFVKHAVYPNADGTIGHAELTLGNGGMVMVSSVIPGTPYAKLLRQPADIEGMETQAPCLIVADCDAVYKTAKAANAKMIIDIADMSYGGRSFTCRDLEGHIWSIGSYNPWAPPEGGSN
ncbi:MAG TPA: VOC family protein [Candidatus Angelobacter sp.]|nr:VOC family protein [Candidatus Angelobacter sp.]